MKGGRLLLVPILLCAAGCATSPVGSVAKGGGRYWTLDQCLTAPTAQVRFNRPDGTDPVTVPRSTCERISTAAGKVQTAARFSVSNIYLADARQPNAFATKDKSGAPIVVITMPMVSALADDEDAWAGLLGHEMAHLVQRHAEQRRKAQAGAIGAGQAVANVIGFVVPGVGGLIGSAVGGTLAQSMVMGAYTRRQEEEADDFGLKWMVAAGYDPRGMERLFNKLSKEQSLPEFLSTHPASDSRAAKIRQYIDAQPERNF